MAALATLTTQGRAGQHPAAANVTLGNCAETWIAQRPGLRRRTIELYGGSLKRHVMPYLGGVPLGKIDSAMIRQWRAQLLGNGTSVSEVAKAYRFLRAVLMTAADDQIIPRNPCRVRGAGAERPDERPVLSVRQVLDLADRMPADEFRVTVLLAAFASLRWGELVALRRCDVDAVAGTVSIRRQFVELDREIHCPGWASSGDEGAEDLLTLLEGGTLTRLLSGDKGPTVGEGGPEVNVRDRTPLVRVQPFSILKRRGVLAILALPLRQASGSLKVV